MKPWSFIHVSDIQPGSPKSYRYKPSLIKNWRQARKQILTLEPDLLLVGGDITRDGGINRFELEEMKADLSSLPFPVCIVPGNMDTGNKHTNKTERYRGPGQARDIELNVTSAQLDQFAEVVGPLWWSVDHKRVRFSGVADVVVNSGLPEEARFWNWAKQQEDRPRLQHQIWVLHYPLFADRSDEPNWDIARNYREWYFTIDEPGRGKLMDLFKATKTDIVISGHVHCHKVFHSQGIRFEIAPATSAGQWGDRWPDGDDTLGFLKYDVAEKGIQSAFIPLEKTWDEKGHGPGGHPAVRCKD